jgi:hypothetical protein
VALAVGGAWDSSNASAEELSCEGEGKQQNQGCENGCVLHMNHGIASTAIIIRIGEEIFACKGRGSGRKGRGTQILEMFLVLQAMLPACGLCKRAAGESFL